jgi:hypothetical protein
MVGDVIPFPIERVHLFENNPRHGYLADPERIISRLVEEEQVYELAKSISSKGTNPLELIGVVRIDDKDEAGEPTYVVWEGNRRVCAIMLLNDPDLAPPKWRKRFQALSNKTDYIEDIEGREFEDKGVLEFWMRNIHNGTQKGRGRKEWGPDEQHRDNPTKKYAIAFELLERAEDAGLISAADRKGKLTTLQRFVGADALRKILQANDENPNKVKFARKKADLEKLLKQIIEDLLDEETITSRKNEDEIKEYAAELEARAGVKPVGGEGEQEADGESEGDDENEDEGDDEGEEDEDETKPKPPHTIKRDKALSKAINGSGNDKLIGLYNSLTKVRATTNVQLIAVGAWSLLETIAAVCGASENQSFTAYFSTGTMQNKLGIGKNESKTIWKALDRFARAGNDTKHDSISAAFNHMELINDMERVSPMLAIALATLPTK